VIEVNTSVVFWSMTNYCSPVCQKKRKKKKKKKEKKDNSKCFTLSNIIKCILVDHSFYYLRWFTNPCDVISLKIKITCQSIHRPDSRIKLLVAQEYNTVFLEKAPIQPTPLRSDSVKGMISIIIIISVCNYSYLYFCLS